MSICLRTITDDRGETVDYSWYCSDGCWSASLTSEPPSETFERGGAYPCGAESDSPDACAHCGAPIGNPITDVGTETVREWLERDEPSDFALACGRLYDIEAAEDEDQDQEPDEDDATIADSRGGYSVGFAGRHLGDFDDIEAAETALAEAMRAAKFWPSVWTISDHGNSCDISARFYAEHQTD